MGALPSPPTVDLLPVSSFLFSSPSPSAGSSPSPEQRLLERRTQTGLPGVALLEDPIAPSPPHPPQWQKISALKGILCEPRLSLDRARQTHSYIVSRGLDQDTHVSNHLISMYGKRSALRDARSVFDCTQSRDVISWSAMLSVYGHHGNSKEALLLLRRMEEEGPQPESVTFVGALRACADPPALADGHMMHQVIVNCGFELDVVVGTALLHMYGQCGILEAACIAFNKLDTCETVVWNAMMAAFSHQGTDVEALELYHEMQHHRVTPDAATFVTAVSSCAGLQDLVEGRVIHDLIRERGFESDSTVANALITMYGKCGELGESQGVFDRMQDRGLASWNAIITAYAQDSEGRSALNLFSDMQQQGIKPDIVTFVSLFRACASLAKKEETDLIHAHCVHSGFDTDLTVGNVLTHSYGECGDLISARVLFDKMPHHNLVSWNTIINIYAEQGEGKEALNIFHRLRSKGLELSAVTFVSTLTACAAVGDLEEGRLLHACIVSAGKEMDVLVGNAVITMYGKCTAMEDACVFFSRMQHQSIVTWNVIMGAYAQLGEGGRVLDVYRQLKEHSFKPDCVTYVNALSGCASQADLSGGRILHGRVIDDGLNSEVLEGSLLNMYGKCGALEDACIAFCKIQQPTVISWNALMSAYALHGYNEEALVLFKKMQQDYTVPSNVTFIHALGVCASLEALAEGQIIHGFIADLGVESDPLVGTALINMYGKCGALEDARHVFDVVKGCDVVVWNVMITVYGQQGHGKKALELFNEMRKKNVKPDEITFVNLLSGCSHTGLVNEGQDCFIAMTEEYHVAPTLAVCGCMVDLLGRAGQLAKAEEFIFERSLQQHSLVWINLLGACRLHGDMERAKCASERIFDLEPKDGGAYVLFSNMLIQEEESGEPKQAGDH